MIPVTVVLADSHQICREGIRVLLEQREGIEILGESATGREALAMCRQLEPQVLVMEVNLPGLNGICVTRRVSTEMPSTKVIALTAHTEHRFIVDMLRAGASGYLAKRITIDELYEAIRSVAAGGIYMNPLVASEFVEHCVRRRPSSTSRQTQLSARELEVLQFVAEGHTTRAIASALELSEKTVASHREHIMRKLDISSIAGLARYAVREGLAPL